MDMSTEEEVRKRIETLPAAIKTLLYSPEMFASLKQVGEKYQLHIDQVGILEAETSEVMLGYTETATFPSVLSDSLNIDEAKATLIAKEIDETLFAKIREDMKKLYEQSRTESPPVQSSPPAISAPLATVASKTDDISVVMPSAAKVVPPAPVAPAPAPTMQTVPVAPSLPAKQIEPPAMAHVDTMLSQPTVSIAPKVAEAPKPAEAAKVEPPKPGPIYKTDPYLEPID
jgi:hypothetical protein